MRANEQQWDAYYAARAVCHRIRADSLRAEAAAARLHPLAAERLEAADYERMAAAYDKWAAELEQEETA